MTEPRYDVAISFLAADETVAAELRSRLSEGLEVFFFPRNQEELAGTDGMASMRTPFLDTRLIVVLYRARWGNTPWTRIEQTAIQEACLARGWTHLFFIMLDDATPPAWLPRHHVRFNYETFGLEQAVGAIKARVIENGGKVTPMTALKRAEQVAQEQAYQAARAALSSDPGMLRVREQVAAVFAETQRIGGELKSSAFPHLALGIVGDQCVVRTGRSSVSIVWRQPYVNSMMDAALIMIGYHGSIPLPGTNEMSLFTPAVILELHYLPDLTRTLEVGWRDEADPSTIHSSAQLADRLLIATLDLAEQANRGDFGTLGL